jgi:5-methylcytosine-specific restriction protein A
MLFKVKIVNHGGNVTERDEAVEALRATWAAMQVMNEAVSRQVRACRRVGVGWGEIASETGVSKPTAISKWKEETEMTVITKSSVFDMKPGDEIRRKDLHDRWGGNRQSGISTPRSGDNIFLFTGSGEDYGYRDKELPDGRFIYNGEGLSRNQDMDRGNKAILTHAEKGKSLRLFKKTSSGRVEYSGEYAYETHEMESRVGVHGGAKHEHIVFTLVPC